MTMKLFVLLILAVFASENENDAENSPKKNETIEEKSIVVKIEEDEGARVNKNSFKSEYIGVTYYKTKWRVQRWSKNENKVIYNGYHDDEETAAHASDNLARKLTKNGEQNHKFNFFDDYTEVYWKKETSSKFIGVSYNKCNFNWRAQRRSKKEKSMIHNGQYDDEETAAHASDTLARKLMKNGEHNHKLNFPDDDKEVFFEVYAKEKSSKFIGVSFHKITSKWLAQRWKTKENNMLHNGSYFDEETAAHASDTLARKLMKNGEQNLKLNFPDDHTEVYPEEKKSSKFIGVTYHKKNLKWRAQRWSKNEKRMLNNGYHNDEETSAHASDTLARKMMENGEQNLKLNFPKEDTEVFSENQNKKRKRPKD